MTPWRDFDQTPEQDAAPGTIETPQDPGDEAAQPAPQGTQEAPDGQQGGQEDGHPAPGPSRLSQVADRAKAALPGGQAGGQAAGQSGAAPAPQEGGDIFDSAETLGGAGQGGGADLFDAPETQEDSGDALGDPRVFESEQQNAMDYPDVFEGGGEEPVGPDSGSYSRERAAELVAQSEVGRPQEDLATNYQNVHDRFAQTQAQALVHQRQAAARQRASRRPEKQMVRQALPAIVVVQGGAGRRGRM